MLHTGLCHTVRFHQTPVRSARSRSSRLAQGDGLCGRALQIGVATSSSQRTNLSSWQWSVRHMLAVTIVGPRMPPSSVASESTPVQLFASEWSRAFQDRPLAVRYVRQSAEAPLLLLVAIMQASARRRDAFVLFLL